MTQEPFVDTHVHFWDHAVPGLRWPWLEPGFTYHNVRGTEVLDAPRYTAEEFTVEAAGAGTEGVVHVQAVDGVEDLARETEWLQEMADRSDLPSAIVGSCVVTAPDAPALIARHARFARFAGVRDITSMRHLDADEAAPALDALAAGHRSLEARRHHDQFQVLDEIAARWPTLTVVLSHACLPRSREASDRKAWSAAVRRLARHPNVVCKISAVAGSSDPDWTIAGIRPWIEACIDAFGPSRCMFGTNWPIDRLHATYLQLVEAYREVIADLDGESRTLLLADTARRVYGIPIA